MQAHTPAKQLKSESWQVVEKWERFGRNPRLRPFLYAEIVHEIQRVADARELIWAVMKDSQVTRGNFVQNLYSPERIETALSAHKQP